VGRVQVAVGVREGLEILRLAAAHGRDGFDYCLAIGLIALSRMGCVSSVGYCRGDDDELDLLELGSTDVSIGEGCVAVAAGASSETAIFAETPSDGSVQAGRRAGRGWATRPGAR